MDSTASHSDRRPALAVIANVPTPYRVHLHRRLAREIPELRLVSFFTHGRADFNWEIPGMSAINPVFLAAVEEDVRGAGRIGNWLRELARATRIIERARREDVAAFVINGYNDLTRLHLVRWCRGHGLPAFVRGDSNIRGDTATGLRAALKRKLVGWVLRNAAGAMPMGRLGQEYFEKYGADPRRCFWVPYEPDYGHFARGDPAEVEAFRDRHGLSPARRHVLSCGRLVAVKRVDLAIDAFARVAARRPEWDLLVAGTGPLRRELTRRVPRELSDRVHFLGFLDVDGTRLAYHASEVLVLPSDEEPWAVVVNEAMAAGLPVVATDVVGAAWELVQDRASGRLVPRGDLEALVEALLDVTDPANLPRYRQAVGPALAAWRTRADPVSGVRAALRHAGVIS
jgi:glycosyltransferase involved in cell wall biosynthesis